jgi:hypothetical protein
MFGAKALTAFMMPSAFMMRVSPARNITMPSTFENGRSGPSVRSSGCDQHSSTPGSIGVLVVSYYTDIILLYFLSTL